MGIRTWTKEEDRLVREQYANLTARQIADALGRGRTPSQVRERAFRMGITSGRQIPPLTKAQAEQAERMLRAGSLVREVAVALKRSVNDMGRQLLKHGVDAAKIKAELTEQRRAARRTPKNVAGVGSVKQGARRVGRRSAPVRISVKADQSLAQRASSFLCRDYVPVFNRGRENKEEAGIWQVGSRRMSEADMIELARFKGMDRQKPIAPAPVIRSSIMEMQRGYRSL